MATRPLTTIASRVATPLFALLLAVVSLTPSAGDGTGEGTGTIPPFVQNAMHVPAYMVLAVLILGSFSTPGRSQWGRILVAAAASTGYGAILELGQHFTQGRVGSVLDILLNTLGAVLGAAAMLAWLRRHPPAGAPIPARDDVPAGPVGDENPPS